MKINYKIPRPVKLNKKGDTIVEVLIALAIIGAVLGGAYSVASSALRNGRSAQERVEALKIAEGQLEWIKYHARNDKTFDSQFRANGYCLEQSTGIKHSSGTPQCTVGLYKISISYVPDPFFVSPTEFFGTFSVTITWERLGGGVDQEMIINYQS